MKRQLARLVLLALPFFAGAGPSAACTNTGSFEHWLSEFRAEARSKGISPRAIAALDGVTFDQDIINRDRRQGVFSQSFLEFSDRMVSKGRIQTGGAQIAKHRAIFDKVEREYGVPAAVITAFWGLETDFGADNGKTHILRSLATLAYDCRRSEKFRAELFDALRIVERGDMRPGEMIGTWAGEIGQTQFVPSIYYKYAVDYDGDGKRDLIHSAPDVIASTANYLKNLGWRRGEPWLQEVRVPENLDWSQAGLDIEIPVSQWAKWGVRRADGGAFPQGDLKAALMLPMGRFGPAFLAYSNFKIYLEWNQSLVYATTVAYYGSRLAGAAPVSRGHNLVTFTPEQTRELQQLLKARGYNVGEVDGKLGLLTRASIKEVQKKFGLPADSYPSAELLHRLQSR